MDIQCSNRFHELIYKIIYYFLMRFISVHIAKKSKHIKVQFYHL